LIGLGNPGARYDATRHNVGWWLVDLLKRRWSATPFQEEDLWLRSRAELAEVGEVWLIKPLTYMNRSGIAVRALLEYRPRFRARGSAGSHNGLQSIEDVLGTREYARLRIGVGAPPAGIELADWVLSEFDDPEDEDAVLETLPRLTEAVELWAREGVEAAMNRYNAPLSDDE
jgi:PTH1 family peptidyl-tRNA hydrolase